MLYSYIKITQPKKYFSEIVWYLIDVYLINRTLRGSAEMRNFSSRVEKYFTNEPSETVQQEKRNFVSPCGHVISSVHFFEQMK